MSRETSSNILYIIGVVTIIVGAALHNADVAWGGVLALGLGFWRS